MKKAFRDWQRANQEKSKLDWLLEERCQNQKQKEDLKHLFEYLEHFGCFSVPYYFDIAPRISCKAEEGIPDGMRSLSDGNLITVYFDFKIGNCYYDLDIPDQEYEFEDRPWEATWKVLRWKAKKLGLDNTNFASHAYKAINGDMFSRYPNWKSYYEEWQKKLEKGTKEVVVTLIKEKKPGKDSFVELITFLDGPDNNEILGAFRNKYGYSNLDPTLSIRDFEIQERID